LLFFCCRLFAQPSYVVEPLDSLFSHIISTHNEQTAEALDNFKTLKDYKTLNLLPSIGLGYDMIRNTPFVTVSASVGQYVNFLQRRDDRKYRMLQMEQQAEQSLDGTLFAVRGFYNRLIRQLDELENRHQIMEINRLLYEIDVEKHRNIEIGTEDLLRSQRTYLTQVSDFNNFKMAIVQTISEIENIIKRALLIQAPLL